MVSNNRPVSPPAQSSVNQNNGNFENAVKNDSSINGGKGGGRGGMSGDMGNTRLDQGDLFEQAKQTGGAGGVVLNPDDLLA